MNGNMYRHPATQTSLTKLKSWGMEILETESGILACGDVDEGRLLDPEHILKKILEVGAQLAPARSLSVLVTSGGTKEAIDGVRSITNTSTGSTGAQIAQTLLDRGHQVTFLHARDTKKPSGKGLHLVPFESFYDLDTRLRQHLKKDRFDGVVHLAAVSDFSVDHLKVDGKIIEPSVTCKLDSDSQVSIDLKKNHKILPRLREYASRADLKVIGFKLTKGASDSERSQAIGSLAESADLVVHNDLNEINELEHKATLYRANKEIARVTTKQEMAKKISEFLEQEAPL
jgi:phosphopantothenoylcysteine decarboxylase / phosphopantothenate---cysteine ligase